MKKELIKKIKIIHDDSDVEFIACVYVINKTKYVVDLYATSIPNTKLLDSASFNSILELKDLVSRSINLNIIGIVHEIKNIEGIKTVLEKEDTWNI